MWRVQIIAVWGLLCASCGGGINSYEDGVEAQAEIMSEMIDILEDVTDQTSADKAASKIEDLGDRLADVMTQLKKLPPPTMEELQDIAQDKGGKTQSFQQEAMPQMMKLAQYPSLMEAWMRAMEKME